MKLTYDQARQRLEDVAKEGEVVTDSTVEVLVAATQEAFDEGYNDGETDAYWNHDDRYDEGYQDGYEEGKSDCDC